MPNRHLRALRTVLREVRKRVHNGQSIEEIDEFILTTSLPEEEKAICWLYAWLGAEPRLIMHELRQRVLAEEPQG